MADGKWIPGLSVETPVVDAAQKVLHLRLKTLRQAANLAVTAADKDVEHVHQLRVATRRASAALRLFAECLPSKKQRTLKRRIRAIRRAAGDARDWDVFWANLSEWAAKRPAADKPGLDVLRGVAFAARERSQKSMRDVAELAPDPNDSFEDLQVPSEWTTLGPFALDALTQMKVEFDQTLSATRADFAQLHQVRIFGKRLRYAFEVFADCFAPPFRARIYPSIEALQEILGDANDSHVAVNRLVEIRDRLKAAHPSDWTRLRPGIERWLQFHRRRLPQARRRFIQWRKRWLAAAHDLSILLLSSNEN